MKRKINETRRAKANEQPKNSPSLRFTWGLRRRSFLIEEDVIRLAKRRAVEGGRPLSDLIRDALAQYLRKDVSTLKERKMAYQLFCERPMKIPPKEIRHMLDDDMWRHS